jgi:hypothetical protein
MKTIQSENLPFKSADGDPLPAVLYHGTTLEAWEKHISKEGLDPGKTEDRGSDTDTKGYTFLSWDKQGAKDFAPGGAYYNWPGPGVILGVQLDAKTAGKIRTALGEFIRCPVLIPPSKLKVVEVTNQKPRRRK